ncbi:hypothetical protein SAMN05192565_12722 [Methylobacterium gossipiicola]|uniref:Nitrogen fixation protein NifZ n=2 Tax=Methylobacterium gossipiicola TaxID=582675 RepID=A0A1I2WTA8_9HYPH|nr:hypothetical protein SAMN05192565_12722 [Methylobacterium gossipiicola]
MRGCQASVKECSSHDVVLTMPLKNDHGDLIAIGTEGMIVSVHGYGQSYMVEFAKPLGAPAMAEPHEVGLQ